MNSEHVLAWNMISGIMEMVSLANMMPHVTDPDSGKEYAHACADLLTVIEAHHPRGMA